MSLVLRRPSVLLSIRCNVAAACRSALHRCALSHAAECVPCGAYWPNHKHTHTHAHAPTRTFYSSAFRWLVPPSNSGHPLSIDVIVIRYRTQNDDDRDLWCRVDDALCGGLDVDVVADTRFLPAAPLPWRLSCPVSCPSCGGALSSSCANEFPPPPRRFLPMHSNLRPSVASLSSSRVLQFAVALLRLNAALNGVLWVFFSLLS